MTMTGQRLQDCGDIEVIASSLVHDVRGLLAAVQLLASVTRAAVTRGDMTAALRALAQVSNAASKGVDLCGDVLECGRRRAASPDLAREAVDLADLARDCVASLGGALERARCSVDLHLAESTIVNTHRRSVERIVVNILRNAIAYGAERPIEIHVTAVGRGALLMVRDHGHGIPKEALDRLFRAWQGGAAGDPAFQRFGLGLWIVKHLVDSLGGVVHVASEPRMGSAIGFALPFRPPPPDGSPGLAGR
jgi:signal transduction histidine kinase